MLKFLTLFSSLISFNHCFAMEKEVYGPDNRLDIYQDMPLEFKQWARSTAALVLWDELISYNNLMIVQSSPLKESQKVCSDEKFVDQPTAATCSGFLVAADLMVTAGHCINPDEAGCGDRVWVFDFAINSAAQGGRLIQKKNIYSCKEIVLRVHDNAPPWNDLALIKLDRPVLDRSPLPVRSSGKIEDGSSVVMIGYPSGLPAKVAGDAKIMNNSNPAFFSASVDAFGRNSGSAVINTETGIVEGILVRGDHDYIVDPKLNCLRPYTCIGEKCSGAEATRITNFFNQESTR